MTLNRIFLKARKPATLNAVRAHRKQLERTIESIVPQVSIRQHILLCFSEAATNLVLHNKANLIDIHFGRDNDHWWLEIFDDGLSWDPTIQENTIPANFELIESGRGTSLLHKQCEKMEYLPGDNTLPNRLRLHWQIAKPQSLPIILIVEDDPSLLRLYTAYLKDSFDIKTANSGHDALKRLNTDKVDLVLSDINMPNMSGFALREQLSLLSDSELIPFIFLTGNDSHQMQKDATDLGIDDYILKPASKSQLINAIHRVLGRSEQVYRKLTDRIDKSITSSLTPKLPDTAHNWRLCVATRHTGSGGGDLLLHQNNTEQLKLVLLDIMGHDDNAKFFAYAYGGYLRGLMQSSESSISPSKLLERLSENALKDELFSKVTLTSCAVNLLSNGKLTLASAAHPPPLLIRKSEISSVCIGGMLPGLIPDTVYQDKTLQLSAGQRLALYTDGLFESADDNNARNDLEEKITKALSDTLHLPIKQSLKQVMNTFDEITGRQPKDDVTLVLLEPTL